MKEASRYAMGRLPKTVTFFSVLYYDKTTRYFAIFLKIIVLLTYFSSSTFGQSSDNEVIIELGQSTFPIERPYLIAVILSNSTSRPAITFPDIPGFTKKGISRSSTPTEINGKTINSQIITQSYQARTSGRFRLAAFTITVDGREVRSEGATLIVQASAASVPTDLTPAEGIAEAPGNELAFLALQTSRSVMYNGEGVGLTLSFFVADNYPYVLNFQSLDRQIGAITKKIRPPNTWEENLPITELKPVPVLIKGKKFRAIRLYQSIFFPLSSQRLNLPAVSLWLSRKPVMGPPTAQDDNAVFTSKPRVVIVRPLPPHPLRGRVPVGQFRLEEELERKRVSLGKSVRYTLAIVGEGNMATLPAPTRLNETTDLDVFPPEEKQTVNRLDDRVTGRKSFMYFIVPHQNGVIALADRFQWIYFDPKTARYDTLHPALHLQIGGDSSANVAAMGPTDEPVLEEGGAVTKVGNSLYAGVAAMDSSVQQISFPVLVRTMANVLIVLMILGIIVVFFKK